MRDREYRDNPHPVYCTCVSCTAKRAARTRAEQGGGIGRLMAAVKRLFGR